MTDFNHPYLLLKRLVVYNYQGAVAYDASFHEGLNIIRGENSSGKSSVSNFIFYALGGDFNNWTTEASLCTDVYAEIVVNSITITLLRKITDKSFQPMSIYYGNFEEAIKSRNDGWKVYPYKQTDNYKSFSNVLFEILGYPETRADTDNKITVHQILRLIYIDQDSPIQNLFRFERFDVSLVRQAISELLLGIYDDSLYNDRVHIRELKREFDDKSKRLANIKSAFRLAGNIISRVDIDTRLKKAEEQLSNLDVQIAAVKEKEIVSRRLTSKSNIELLQQELRQAQEGSSKALETIDRLDDEILDSSFFIETLKKRVQAIDDSIYTKSVFGTLPIYHCPQCLNELKGVDDSTICGLCKEPITLEENKSQSLRIKQELLLQIKESTELLRSKVEANNANKINIKSVLDRVRLKQKDFDIALKDTSSNRDTSLNELYSNRGSVESQMEYLIEQRKTVDLLEGLSQECSVLNIEIDKLKLQIDDKENLQKQRFYAAQTDISRIAKYILSKDLDRQNEFKNANHVNVDYTDDVFDVDGKFNFSASSNTYLKNAVRFAIFFASLSNPLFRFPRFILCDNVEDKGMEEVRSKNFQRVIAEISKRAPSNHQIILTTSMVDEGLNQDPTLVIGDFYDHSNKTLKV
jgi:hypothetical protein